MLIQTSEELEQLQKIANSIDSTSRNLFYAFLACKIITDFALGQLWVTFQTLQVIIALQFVMAAKMPPNVLEIFSGFSDIVNLKLIDPKTALNWLSIVIQRKSIDTSTLLHEKSSLVGGNRTSEQDGTFRLLNESEYESIEVVTGQQSFKLD